MRNTVGTTLCNHGTFQMESRSLSRIDAARKFDCPTVRHQRITLKELILSESVNGVRLPLPQARMNGIVLV